MRAFRSFGEHLMRSTVGLFYYADHGIHVKLLLLHIGDAGQVAHIAHPGRHH